MSLTKEIIMERANETRNECNEIDFDQVGKLVNILDIKRVDNYEYWIRLVWLLRNIDHRLLNVWEDASKKSSKYVDGECETQWLRMRTNLHGLGLGTLHMWAKEDNRDAYNDIIFNDLRDLIRKSVSVTHTGVSHVVHFMYRNRFVCSSLKYKTWYEFKNHRRHPCDNGVSLRKALSNEVYAEYMRVSKEYSQRAIDARNDENKTNYEQIAKSMISIASKLRNCSFKQNILNRCMELFYDNKFEELLDVDENLIGFENGIFDLNTMEFREGKPDDHVSLSTASSS